MSKRWFAGCALTILLATFLLGTAEPERFTATFSIVAYDPATGDLGVAVASKFPAVGAMVPYARAGVGAVATQAAANLRFGSEGLKLLESGLTPQQAIEKLVENDPGRGDRQMGLVDARGRSAAWTGKDCFSFAGHIVGENYSVQGNILTGREVLVAMSETFTSARGTLTERLMAAVEAGDAAGGDQRGKESAAMLVVREGAGYGGVDRKSTRLNSSHRQILSSSPPRLPAAPLWAGVGGAPPRGGRQRGRGWAAMLVVREGAGYGG